MFTGVQPGGNAQAQLRPLLALPLYHERRSRTRCALILCFYPTRVLSFRKVRKTSVTSSKDSVDEKRSNDVTERNLEGIMMMFVMKGYPFSMYEKESDNISSEKAVLIELRPSFIHFLHPAESLAVNSLMSFTNEYQCL